MSADASKIIQNRAKQPKKMWPSVALQVEHRQEGRLRHVDLAEGLHALLALGLLVEQLLLARDIAPVALGEHVLAYR